MSKEHEEKLAIYLSEKIPCRYKLSDPYDCYDFVLNDKLYCELKYREDKFIKIMKKEGVMLEVQKFKSLKDLNKPIAYFVWCNHQLWHIDLNLLDTEKIQQKDIWCPKSQENQIKILKKCYLIPRELFTIYRIDI